MYQKLVATYAQHFRNAGLQQPPHILVVYDRIKLEERKLVDAIDSSGSVHKGPSDTKFAHHKMANWRASANHYGYDVYIFLSGHITHAGGGKGYVMNCSPYDLLSSRETDLSQVR